MRSTPQDPVAVVGAAGFLGRAFLQRLHESGRAHASFTRNMPLVKDGLLAKEAHEVRSVVWLASSINPLVAEANPELVDSDLQTLRETLSGLQQLSDPPRFILLSSGGTVYGHSSAPPHREADEPHPSSAYGHAKLAMENIALDYLDDCSVVRVANAYGPGQPVARGQGVIAHWLRAIRRAEPVRVFGDTRTTRDYVYAADVADALGRLCDVETAPRVVNIGSGDPTSLSELLDIVLRAVDQERVLVEYASGRSFDVPASYLDTSVARTVLGWQTNTDLQQGIALTWDTVSNFGDTQP